eukprot:3414963-Alexandrium_andersonii.AAC.1
MSASLVGSEMCIRDRLRGQTLDPIDQIRSNRSTGPSSEQRGNTRDNKARAVSYTHLTLPTICSV